MTNNPTLWNPVFYFVSGLSCMGALVCALFFLRFWRKTAERLFLIFAFSFLLLAAERAISATLFDLPDDNRAAVYLIRLAAFLMILGGIWDKNRAARQSQASS